MSLCRLEEGVQRAEAQLFSAIIDQNIPRIEEFQVGGGIQGGGRDEFLRGGGASCRRKS
jgi:hypothetical protein